MKKILITGAGGFIGSHLTELCVHKGYAVRAFIHYNSTNHSGWLEDSSCKEDIEFFAGDIRDYDAVFKALKGCEAVFHLAALIGIPYSYLSPLAYIRVNVEGAYNVLQAAREQQTKSIVMTSTSETYGTAQYVPIDEKHPIVGQSPYAASKVAADQLAMSYYRSFGLPVKIARPFNTFGPRQSARAVIPTIITQLLNGQRELKLGNTQPTRDFTYVQDTVEGILRIGETHKLSGEAVNIGMNQEIAVGELAQMIAQLMNKKIKILKDTLRIRPLKSEVERLVCDHSKLVKATKWKPRFDLKKGLSETIQFIEKNCHRYKAEIYNI